MVHLTHITKPVRGEEVMRSWHLLDAKDKVLGRLATFVAGRLIGKHKTNYSNHQDSGDNVVVINAGKIRVTGTKEQNKIYSRYSGYPGGLKQISYFEMKEKKPEEIIRRAVSGMLPKNKLRNRRIARLYIYRDGKHPYEDKFSRKLPK